MTGTMAEARIRDDPEIDLREIIWGIQSRQWDQDLLTWVPLSFERTFFHMYLIYKYSQTSV